MATVPEFRNEPYADFSQPANRQAMEEALRQVRSEFGREYLLRIGGEYISTGDKLESVNPSRPSEIVGVHHRADAVLAARAIEAAWQYFPEWSRVPAADRIGMTFEAARILRRRKIEFDAWLVYEAGKTWPEAEADVSEAIDFCEYYAREMSRLAGPQPVVQLPGEHDEMIYIPLGVGVVIPPWNFPAAILVGMTVASLVAGNTVVLKPSSETPTIGAKFAEVLLEAGFPERSITLLTGSGATALPTLGCRHGPTARRGGCRGRRKCRHRNRAERRLKAAESAAADWLRHWRARRFCAHCAAARRLSRGDLDAAAPALTSACSI